MLAKVLTGAAVGLECSLVRVEVDLAQGLPNFIVVGLPDTAVQEARERVRAAIRQRCRVPVMPETHGRREASSRAHREIGRQTDFVRTAGVIQTGLLVAIGLVLLLLAAVVLRWLP